MTDLKDYMPDPGEEGWHEALEEVLDQVDAVMAAAAPASHTHGGSGVVVYRGASTARPTPGDNLDYIYINTTDNVIERCNEGVVKEILAGKEATVRLHNWQSLPGEYTVGTQDILDNGGFGLDLFYKYVFSGTARSIMYSSFRATFSGLDLYLYADGRMSTAETSKTIDINLHYAVISTGDSLSEVANYAGFSAIEDAAPNAVITAPDTANQIFSISDSGLKIPSSAYSDGDIIFVGLDRNQPSASDTHGGNLETADSIVLRSVAP